MSDSSILALVILFYFRLCPSADSFYNADLKEKRDHCTTLWCLLCMSHMVPFACKSEVFMRSIFFSEDCAASVRYWTPRNFHARWTLDGWNDHIIQPALDAVLNYYKVCIVYPIFIYPVLISEPF